RRMKHGGRASRRGSTRAAAPPPSLGALWEWTVAPPRGLSGRGSSGGLLLAWPGQGPWAWVKALTGLVDKFYLSDAPQLRASAGRRERAQHLPSNPARGSSGAINGGEIKLLF